MFQRAKSIGCSATLALIVLGAAPDASAYCRTRTKSDPEMPPDYNAEGQGCWAEGIPLFWLNACVGYSMQISASKKVSYADASNLISTAFTRWTGATCDRGDNKGRSRTSIDVRDLGPALCASVSYDAGGPNQNVIIFRDDTWKYPPQVLGLTTVNYNPKTGEIYNADMELNTFDMDPLAIRDPVGKDDYDFLSVVTHEAGHFLGMAHSEVSGATMYARYDLGQTNMRYLSDDDITGICTVYRPDGNRAVLNGLVAQGPQCDPTPRGGYITTCPDPSGCGCKLARPSGSSSLLAGVALAAATIVRRRRRSERGALRRAPEERAQPSR